MNWLQVSIGLLGGIGIFLFGMYQASEGLKKVASHQLKHFMRIVTKNQVYGAGAGTILAAALQSSTAATVMVVGFINARLISLRRAMGVMLGSAIGTTLTVQLIAFQIMDYALLIVGVGVFLFFVASNSRIKTVGTILLGFGFVFFGMGLMTETMEPLQENPTFLESIVLVTDNLLFTVLVATLLTAIIQNSAATIALAMALTASGTLSLEAAVAVVYGANLGTVVTAMISSLQASKDAQRAAVAHGLFKLIGVLLFLPLTQMFVQVLPYIGGDLERQIANAHTLFNVVNLVILLPFCNQFAKWMTRLLPEKQQELKHVKHIDPTIIEFPTVALLQAQKELGHMATIIQEDLLHHFKPMVSDAVVRDRVLEKQRTVNHLYKAVYHYLQHIMGRNLSDQESEKCLKLLYVNSDLEGISNVIAELALSLEKLESANKTLSAWEQNKIYELYQEVLKNYTQTIQAFETENREVAMQVIQRNPKIIRVEREFRFTHFYDRTEKSSTVSAVFFDLINGLLRVQQHNVSMSQTVIGMI